ncbi:hypothetical protein N480_14675 [Pseudoalteromonas luteoviolacea S2607]|uniref:hypothetical protein n=1 Tax=Pseudoalteromonas luteoviolacea TaxID=43657 RepID=UPI0007B08F30|nr:hypothetical protein [Pseudoalteromonas luteoviolacea]KZN37985.1 hypothetical protein N480_14675 [Pseudoalteromonas luteoviolacea S2607]
MKAKKIAHKVAGGIALMTLLVFLSATLYSELIGNYALIAKVKSSILSPGLFILIPCLIVTAGSGFNMAKGSKNKKIKAKAKRMPFIGLNGLLVLVPCALYLNYLAQSSLFGFEFYLVQSVEVVAGLVNISLISLNIRDGLRLSKRPTQKEQPAI